MIVYLINKTKFKSQGTIINKIIINWYLISLG